MFPKNTPKNKLSMHFVKIKERKNKDKVKSE